MWIYIPAYDRKPGTGRKPNPKTTNIIGRNGGPGTIRQRPRVLREDGAAASLIGEKRPWTVSAEFQR
jgi:hypothetical protein